MAHLLFLPILQLLLLYCTKSAQAQLNISIGSSLTPQGVNNSWISPSADFAFGFLAVDGNSSSYLLAVWFNKIADKTVVWYARTSSNGKDDTIPVQVQSGSVLKLADGALSLRDPSGNEVWNPQVTDVGYARMLDTGNFRLLGTDGATKWESFGDPSDTILPTQVLSLGTALHSRLLATDYSNGRFQLKVQRDGNLVMYPDAVPSGYLYDPYWASNTVDNGSQLVFNETGRIYFTIINGSQVNITSAGVDSMGDFFHRATLDTDGVFRQYVYPKNIHARPLWPEQWTAVDVLPENICQSIQTMVGSGACGFNSYCTIDGTKNTTSCLCPQNYKFIDDKRKYKGCRPDFEPQNCDLDETTAMLQYDMAPIDRVDWPLSDYEQYNPIDQTECRRLCVTDCFCAVAVFDKASSTCWKKRFPLSNGKMDVNVPRTVLIKVPRSTNSPSVFSSGSSKWKEDKKYWILGSSLLFGSSVLVNFLLISVMLFGTYCSITSRKKTQLSQPSNNSGLPPKIFTYSELEKATGGFQEVLGTGASGVVYKGQLQDEFGTNIAVKKIEKLQQEAQKEFLVEVQTIGQTFHRNLVRLLGFCNEGTERLLVYEFMSNGSLNTFLFSDTHPHWSLRVQVALGVARGLLYLHEECNKQIIHCDMKPQNILLDDNFVAKISDFGLAKLLPVNQTQTNTGIRGTRGYVAPEWFKNIGITSKVDVYSFGVILLELVCCRKNVELEVLDEEQTILTYWANDCYKCGRIDLLVAGDDEAIFNIKKVERFVAVALWCLQEEPSMRPTMLKVTQMLDGAVQIPTPPDPSSYISSLA
ncbi:LOW QUALITY PROTEIN: G-type lectin S-receptor-like serine/threonine-protein kinase LECRK3 [Oryza sativa Japonica Group]|uniref:LOW QUALITY PROTEIN: G-type lectin S-receptor-like serine/threonine-protein kinase LECRK3 n=1 Tax=Oryza sativa subsp. japonica TaxID=39947 RepID=UPI000E1B950E|nr:LOW QUALITY PROTEIN: G-type lectin S-receptor-like serine/threonine-protein kinase LECRK3 [Oryza sativa Japonica Group]